MKLRQLLLALGIVSLLGASANADPLPKGAQLRLGNHDLILRGGTSRALVPPEYNLLMLPESPEQFRFFDLKTGKFRPEKGPTVELGGPMLLSSDGKRMVILPSAQFRTADGRLVVHDAKTGKVIVECRIPTEVKPTSSDYRYVAFAGNGRFLALAGSTGEGMDAKPEVVVWDLQNLDKDGTAKIATRITPWRMSPAQPPVVHPLLSEDGKLLATRPGLLIRTPTPGSPEDEARRAVQVWDAATGKELFKVRVSGKAIWSTFEFSPDGTLLATGCGDAVIDLWDMKMGKKKFALTGCRGQGVRLAFAPDSKSLAAVSDDGIIERWNTADGKLIDSTKPPADATSHRAIQLVITPDGHVLALGGALGGTVVVWEAPSGKYLTPSSEHISPIQSVAFADNGKHVITSGMDRRLIKWDAATGQPLGAVPLKPTRTVSFSRPYLNLSRDGKRGLTVGQPTVVFDVTTGTQLFEVHRGVGYFHCYLSAEGKRVLTLTVPHDTKKSPNARAEVWDVETSKKTAEIAVPFDGPAPRPPGASLSPSGDRLVVARRMKGTIAQRDALVITGWDLKTGKKLSEIEDVVTQGFPTITAISERTAILTTTTGRVRSVDYELGRGGETIEPIGRGDSSPIVLSPDHKRYAYGVATNDPTVFAVRIHEWPSGKELHTFVGHRGPITALAFSPDSKTLATGSSDTTVVLWDLTAIGKPK